MVDDVETDNANRCYLSNIYTFNEKLAWLANRLLDDCRRHYRLNQRNRTVLQFWLCPKCGSIGGQEVQTLTKFIKKH